MRRLRWRLARLIAGVPIIRDPFPASGGVVILARSGGVEWALYATRFRMKSTRRLQPLDYGSASPHFAKPSTAFTRFVGTVAHE